MDQRLSGHGFYSKCSSRGFLQKMKKTFTFSHNPEYSLEGLMLNLKLQYFGHLM